MVKIDNEEYQVIGKGVCYGVLPKVGERGLMILRKLYDGKWHFNFDDETKVVLLDNFGKDGTVSFQTWHNAKFEWFHGVVDVNGKITQIG